LATRSTKKRPTLETERLILRPFEPTDAPCVALLAGERDVAKTTMALGHPYELSSAEGWIASHPEAFENGKHVVFAVTLKSDHNLIGAMGLVLNLDQEKAELGYWIGKPYWSRGYCKEAARAVLEFAFTEFRLNRVHAHHFSHNPASGRVMQKVGMRHEGHLRRHVKKWGEFYDVEAYGILRSDFV
jgi:[ribosomal protein S5]-alanine N-acetyltransferase